MQEILSFEFDLTYHMIPEIQRCCRETCITSEGFLQFDLIFLRIHWKILGIQYVWSLSVLDWAGVELIFVMVGGIRLCFGFLLWNTGMIIF